MFPRTSLLPIPTALKLELSQPGFNKGNYRQYEQQFAPFVEHLPICTICRTAFHKIKIATERPRRAGACSHGDVCVSGRRVGKECSAGCERSRTKRRRAQHVANPGTD